MTKQFNTGLGIFLAIDIPKEAKRFEIFNDKNPYLSYFNGYITPIFYLPSRNYKIIGLQSEIESSEDLSSKVIEIQDEGLNVITYKVYDDLDVVTNKPCLSFKSLMRKEELWLVNPYQNDWDELCTWGHGDFGKDGKTSSELYREAQLITSERLILKKI